MIKKIAIFFAALIALVIIAIVGLVVFINPNNFKPMIVEQAKEKTGFDLVIEGDISWSFFPSLGFSLGKTELNNPNDFDRKQIVMIDEVGLDISVMPLFSKTINIGQVRLDGADIFVQTKKDGTANYQLLVDQSTTESTEAAEEIKTEATETTETAKVNDWEINLEGVAITNAKLEMIDDAAGTKINLTDVNFNLSSFSFDQWASADFGLAGKNGSQEFTAKGSTDFQVSKDMKQYQVRNVDLNATFKDPNTNISSATVKLDTFELGKEGQLEMTVKGVAAGMNLNFKHSAKVKLEADMSAVSLDNMNLSGSLSGDSLPVSPMNLSMSSTLNVNLTDKQVAFNLAKLAINEIVAQGTTNVNYAGDIPAIRFALTSQEINLDKFLGTAQESSSEVASDSSTTTASTAPATTTEPDLSATRNLDVAGTVKVTKLIVSKAVLENIALDVAINRGLITLKSLTANLYGGNIKANATVDARKNTPSYKVSKTLTGIKIQSLLSNFSDINNITGTANLVVNVSGQSLIPAKLKQNLTGTIQANLLDGTLQGINIDDEIEKVKALVRGEAMPAASGQNFTKFMSLTSSMNLSKGAMNTSNISLKSPVVNMLGKGQVNYLKETVNLTFNTTLVEIGKDEDDILKNIVLPIEITGSWAAPKITPNVTKAATDLAKIKAQSMAQEKVNEQIDKVLEGTGLGDDVKNAVGGFLNSIF